MNINGITTIVSSSCNLKCSFCYLHKHNALINFDKEILEAWNNFLDFQETREKMQI